MATLVFDIGKTNKKAIVFDEDYQVLHQEREVLPEIVDEDGVPTEDLERLCTWIDQRLDQLVPRFGVSRINYSTYGASLVHLDAEGQPTTPLYNYLKSISTDFLNPIYRAHGGPQAFHAQTGSPPLAALNSGFQLAWLQQHRPQAFAKTRHTLHLPQFLSYRNTGVLASEYTSIGCHTGLWDFPRRAYHHWLSDRGLLPLLPSPRLPTTLSDQRHPELEIGLGVHDSSAALLPYLRTNQKPFVLLSTGTWSIALNPWNDRPLTTFELSRDCLTFLRPDGAPVKAARLFLGFEHDHQVKLLQAHYGQGEKDYQDLRYEAVLDPLDAPRHYRWAHLPDHLACAFETTYPDTTFAAAYHRLLRELVDLQLEQLDLVVRAKDLRHLIVDGGFTASDLLINMLKRAYPGAHIESSATGDGSALGAAMLVQEPERFCPSLQPLRA